MPRTYDSNKPVPLRALPKVVRPAAPAALIRKEVIVRLQEALGNDWVPINDLKTGSALLSKALGPGWSISELRQLTRNGSLSQGQHWYKRGGRYSVDVVAIASWHLNQEGEV